MAITTKCKECGAALSFPNGTSGKKGKCRSCGAAMVIPAPAARAGDAEPPEPDLSLLEYEEPAPAAAALPHWTHAPARETAAHRTHAPSPDLAAPAHAAQPVPVAQAAAPVGQAAPVDPYAWHAPAEQPRHAPVASAMGDPSPVAPVAALAGATAAAAAPTQHYSHAHAPRREAQIPQYIGVKVSGWIFVALGLVLWLIAVIVLIVTLVTPRDVAPANLPPGQYAMWRGPSAMEVAVGLAACGLLALGGFLFVGLGQLFFCIRDLARNSFHLPLLRNLTG